MKISKKISTLLLFWLFISACGNLLDDYASNPLDASSIDQEMCRILNELESVAAITFSSDSLTEMTIFDSLVQDSSSFVHLSNMNNWEVAIDSSCYFILHAPQEADSYFVALNLSSEFHLYSGDGTMVEPDSETTSLKSIAGLSRYSCTSDFFSAFRCISCKASKPKCFIRQNGCNEYQ